MQANSLFMVKVASIVALGGFLMGFDSSVVSGVVGFIEVEFELSSLELGWSVSSLTLTATLAMMVAGPISDRIGRRPVLQIASVLFALSAIASAVAPNFLSLVLARMLGGFGVGAALIIAPMFIAEMAPPQSRGRLVSFNQLNIVIGISVAFFCNYLILSLSQSGSELSQTLRLDDWTWRWMLGIELIPAILYYAALLMVPESPRWLVMRGRVEEAQAILERVNGVQQAAVVLETIKASVDADSKKDRVPLLMLLHPSMKLVLTIGICVGVLQQITGINAVFFYSPMIFEQSGIGTNASFMQAILVGLTNVAFTVAAMLLIDRIGRRSLLGFGLSGIAVCMLLLSYGFGSATYTLDQQAIDNLPAEIDRVQMVEIVATTYTSDIDFREAVSAAIGEEDYRQFESQLVSSAIKLQPLLILFAILGFVASFAISIGPIMWVLFSELFPNRVRGLAISLVGFVNSAIAFLVTLLFPWELENLGNATTFLIYGVFAVIGLVVVMRILPETKGRTLEQIEHELVRS